MGCCSSRISPTIHEARFVQIKILIEEISEYLYQADFEPSPISESMNSYINHLNALIDQIVENLNRPLQEINPNSYKTVTEEKLLNFSNSLSIFYNFLQTTNRKIIDKSTKDFLRNLREKVFDIQFDLKNSINKAIIVFFPAVNSKNLAFKGVFKKDFDDIFSEFEKLFQYVIEKLKEFKRDFFQDFRSIISSYFWLNNFCNTEQSNGIFNETILWLNFKENFQKFVEETLQMNLNHNELMSIKSELDKSNNNRINFKSWDFFYCKTWADYRRRNAFLKKSQKDFSSDKISLILEDQQKAIKIKIFQEYYQNNEIMVNEDYLQNNGLYFGRKDDTQVDIKGVLEEIDEVFFNIHLGCRNETKEFFIINSSKKNPLRFLLNEKPYILKNDICFMLEEKYIIKVGNLQNKEECIDLTEFNYIESESYEDMAKKTDLNRNKQTEELNLIIYDKNLQKLKEYNLNLLDVSYKIYEDGNDLIINSKENINDNSKMFGEIKYIINKNLWVLQKQTQHQTSYPLYIFPFSFSKYQQIMRKTEEEIIYPGQIINNDTILCFAGIIFKCQILIENLKNIEDYLPNNPTSQKDFLENSKKMESDRDLLYTPKTKKITKEPMSNSEIEKEPRSVFDSNKSGLFSDIRKTNNQNFISNKMNCDDCKSPLNFQIQVPDSSMTYFCKRCTHKIEKSCGAYVCPQCSVSFCKLCYLGVSPHCLFCKSLFEGCIESLEGVRYKKFFCSFCFKEKYIINGLYQCKKCNLYSICLNCRSNLTIERKLSILTKNIIIFEYQRRNAKEEWEEFKEEEAFFSHETHGIERIKKNVEKFLINYSSSYKITKTWQIEEKLKGEIEGWEYFSNEDKTYGLYEELEGIHLEKRRRKWVLTGEKICDFNEGVF